MIGRGLSIFATCQPGEVVRREYAYRQTSRASHGSKDAAIALSAVVKGAFMMWLGDALWREKM